MLNTMLKIPQQCDFPFLLNIDNIILTNFKMVDLNKWYNWVFDSSEFQSGILQDISRWKLRSRINIICCFWEVHGHISILEQQL